MFDSKEEILARIAEIDKRILSESTTSDALKVTLNSTFGKLNDRYSPLRSVPSALRVTINGQLFLLMLIERLALVGAEILSANTDGVTVRMHRNHDTFLAEQMRRWEADTGFELEKKEYRVYARRDVNTYVAVDTKGDVKTKGAFNDPKQSGNIIALAAIDHIVNGTDIRKAVEKGRPEDYLFYQRVKNGGTLMLYASEFDLTPTPIGRLCRWYATAEGPTLKRRNPNGTVAKIPHGEHVQPCMTLTDFDPFAVDFNHYAIEAQALVDSLSED